MKNKHNLQRLIGGIIFAIGVVLCVLAIVNISGEGGLGTGMIFFCVALPFLAVGAIWYFIATSNSRKICDKCGGKMTGCSYEYQESRRVATPSSPYSYKVTVHIIATCPNCGARKAFNKTFRVSSGENPQYLVDQFCRNHFGH